MDLRGLPHDVCSRQIHQQWPYFQTLVDLARFIDILRVHNVFKIS